MKLNWESISYIFQIPLSWFRDADRRLNIFSDGNIVRVDRNNPDGTFISIDTDALDKAPKNETNFAVFETPSANDSTVSTGHSSNALLNTTWTRGDVDANDNPVGVRVYLPTDSWGDHVSRSIAWRLCEFDHAGRLQKVYAQTIRTEAVNMDQINA